MKKNIGEQLQKVINIKKNDMIVYRENGNLCKGRIEHITKHDFLIEVLIGENVGEFKIIKKGQLEKIY
jgi:hypothetical protein